MANSRFEKVVGWYPHIKRVRWLLIVAAIIGGIFSYRAIFGIPEVTWSFSSTSILAVLGAILVVVGATTLLQYLLAPEERKKKRGERKKTDKDSLTWWGGLLQSFKDVPKNYIKSWMLYPVFIYGTWSILVFYILQNFFPRYYHWLWISDSKIWFLIPTIVLAAVVIYRYKRFAPNVGATILLILMFQATWSSYKKTPMWAEQEAERTVKEATQSATAEAEREKLQQEILVTATYGRWSEVQEIPTGWTYWVKPDGEVEFEADRKAPQRDGPNRLTDYGCTTRFLRFRSVEPSRKDVIVTLKLLQRK